MLVIDSIFIHEIHFSVVDILLKATGDAPIMKKKKWQVDRTKRISWVSEFIRKYIKSDPSESLVSIPLAFHIL